MKKGYVGLLACASGILIGLGISRLDLTGYLEKTQEQEYHPVERKVPESVESKQAERSKTVLAVWKR